MNNKTKWFWPAALLVAFLADFLFWGKAPGISLPIWTAIVLLTGFLLSWSVSQRPSPWTVLIAVLTLFFSAVPAFRENLFVVMFSLLMLVGGLLLVTATFLNGNWIYFRAIDYITEFAKVIWNGLIRPFSSAPQSEEVVQPPQKTFWRRFTPVLRGVLIAFPVLAVFSALFASADPVFNEGLKRILNLEHLPEYFLRFILILLLGFCLVGIYLHAILPAHPASRPDPSKPWMKPFLGWTETAILLGALDLLFITFVILQVRYLFGGMANINETGFTYSEYARRGFNELVVVAVMSILLILSLATVARLENQLQKTGFTVGAVLLMANVLVILASSLQRLMLYENAYGFSEQRTLSHIFIYWLGAVVLTVIVLELVHQRGRFALALLVAAVGFSLSLVIINVDGFVARQNVQRAVQGEDLDVAYFSSLSDDFVPVIMEFYKNPALPAEVHQALGVSLACRSNSLQNESNRPWQSINFSRSTSEKMLQDNSALWSNVKISKDDDGIPYTMWKNEKLYCSSRGGMD
jgi:hypothetical protein